MGDSVTYSCMKAGWLSLSRVAAIPLLSTRYILNLWSMSRARAKTNKPLTTSPCGDGLDVSLVSTAAPLVPPQLESKQVTQSTFSQYAPDGRVCPASALIDKHKLNTKLAQSSLILITSHLRNDVSARRLIETAQTAYDTRQLDRLTSISQALADHRDYKSVAAYYLGLAEQRLGQGRLDRAQALFEYAADSAPARFKAKALLALGAVSGYKGNITDELSFYSQTLKITEADYWTRIETNRAIAFNYTLAGQYQRAIDLLEGIAPLARAIAPINPRLYFDCLNNYAVNLHAIGRLQEAVRLAEYICRSPLAVVYPEWQETKEEAAADLAQQQPRAIIISIPELQHEDSDASEPPQVEYPRLVILPAFASFVIAGMILSRFRYSIHPHAPPILSRK